MGPMAILCPKCGFPTSPGPRGECRACGAATPPGEWIRLPEDSIPPVPGVGHPDPRVCPSCGAPLLWQRGCGLAFHPLVQFGALYLLLCLMLLPLLVLHVRSGPPLLLAAILGGVLLGSFARHRGHRFATEGVVGCPECDYVRLGRDESAELERTRNRAAAAFRRFRCLLVLPAAFLLVMGGVQWVRGSNPGAYLSLALGFLPPALFSVMLLGVYRPTPLDPTQYLLRAPPAWESEWRRAPPPRAVAARDREAP